MAKKKTSIVSLNNVRLEEAMAAFKEDNGKENLRNLLTAFIGAKLLVPAEPPKDISDVVKAKIAMKKPLEAGEMPRALPILLKNPNGECLVPVYTNRSKVTPDRKYPLLLTLPTREVVRVALAGKKDNIVGIIINAGTDNMTLHQKFVESVAQAFSGAEKLTGQKKLSKAEFDIIARIKAETDIIPKRVYSEKSEFMKKIDEGKEEFVVSVYKEIYTDKIPCPLAPSDISVMLLDIGDMTVAQITLPEKKTSAGEALFIYVAQKGDEMDYYYIEKGKKDAPNVITRITSEGLKQQLRTAPSPGTELSEVIDLLQEEK